MTDLGTSPSPPPIEPPSPLFAARYRLVGRRGSGVDVGVFEVVDSTDGRTLALKVVNSDIVGLDGFATRFTETMGRVQSIEHPNLAAVVDHGAARWNGEPVQYVATEHLTGGSLRDLRDRGRILTPSQAVVVGIDACRALDTAHRNGLVHGDVRPTTLVFGADRRLRLTDLGLGGLVAGAQWNQPGGLILDRAKYASPEQASGGVPTTASDVYALSLCLVEAVTGQLPFVADSTVATLANRVDKLLPVSADLGPLAAVLERAARPDPSERYTAAQLGMALVQVAEKLPRPEPIDVLGTGLFAEEPVVDLADTDTAAVAGVAGAAVAAVAAAPALLPPPPAVPVDASPTFANPVPPVEPDLLAAAAAADNEPAAVDSHVETPTNRQPRSRRWVLVAIAGIVGLLAVGITGWFISRPASHPVPELTGLETGEALNLVSTFGWNIDKSEVFDDLVLAGYVIRTDPKAGTLLQEGKTFTLVISKGPAPQVLPDITGMTVPAADAALSALGLVLQADQKVADESIPEGTIISWSVPSQPSLVAGGTVLPGTIVSAVVSTGPAPRTLPDLRGQTLADATTALADLGLVLAQGPDEFSDTPQGSVSSQDPAPGTALPRGSTVTLVVSKGRDLVPVPSLAGLNLTQATAALQAAGFVVGTVTGDPTTPLVQASASGVEVVAGEPVPRGSAIDLTFGTPAG
jgi:eukaryotic-like serine/threonine-protein kinase